MSKVLIPEFVANYIEQDKGQRATLGESLNESFFNESEEDVYLWLYNNEYTENDKRVLLFAKAWVEGYEIEPEQRYYWRKKKEYLAWFEDNEQVHIVRFRFSDSDVYQYCLGETYLAFKLTEQEARDLLKQDFDMFEKVEV